MLGDKQALHSVRFLRQVAWWGHAVCRSAVSRQLEVKSRVVLLI